MDFFLKAACHPHPSPDVTFKKYHLINGSLAPSSAKFPPEASGHSLGALVCRPALPGGDSTSSPLGPAARPLAQPTPRPAPPPMLLWWLSRFTVDPTPPPGLCRRDPSPGSTSRSPRPEIPISHLSVCLSLSDKPNILTLLVVGEQIFPPNNWAT